jgi:hypothetical protein
VLDITTSEGVSVDRISISAPLRYIGLGKDGTKFFVQNGTTGNLLANNLGDGTSTVLAHLADPHHQVLAVISED